MPPETTFEFCAELKWETKGAYKLFDGAHEVWVPKSKVKLKKLRTTDGVDDVSVVMPLWLAREKGVV